MRLFCNEKPGMRTTTHVLVLLSSAAVQCCIVVQCSAVQCSAVLHCSAVQCSAVQCSSVLLHAVKTVFQQTSLAKMYQFLIQHNLKLIIYGLSNKSKCVRDMPIIYSSIISDFNSCTVDKLLSLSC
jgi:hypothetical protein